MTTFGDALRKGMDAHTRAAAARREMDEVLAQASQEIAAVVGAPISLRFDVVDRPRREPNLQETRLGQPAPREKVTMLVAKLSSGPFERLADIELSEIGYPIELRWGDHVEHAGDRSGFEAALT